MDAVELRNNTATSRGGGVYSNVSRLKFTQVALRSNGAGQHGGGVYVLGSGTGSGNAFCDVDVDGNIASSGAGGGIYMESTAFGALICPLVVRARRRVAAGMKREHVSVEMR